MKFTHIHSSSKWSGTVESLLAAAQGYNLVADLVTYTEVDKGTREAGWREAGGKDFGLVSGDHGGRNDAVIAFRKEKLTLIHSDMVVVPNSGFTRPNGNESALLYGTLAVFETTDKKRFAVMVVHLSSSVEGDFAKKTPTERTREWVRAFHILRKALRAAQKEYKCEAAFFIADFNLNFKFKWVRALVKTLAPSFSVTWGAIHSKLGTHGRRVIDATLGRGKFKVIRKPRLFKDDNSSDHRPYVEVLEV